MALSHHLLLLYLTAVCLALPQQLPGKVPPTPTYAGEVGTTVGATVTATITGPVTLVPPAATCVNQGPTKVQGWDINYGLAGPAKVEAGQKVSMNQDWIKAHTIQTMVSLYRFDIGCWHDTRLVSCEDNRYKY
jgi:hypothetical protein